MPTKTAALLKATSRLRSLVTKMKSSEKAAELDLSSVEFPVDWKETIVPAEKKTFVSKRPQSLGIQISRNEAEMERFGQWRDCPIIVEEDVNLASEESVLEVGINANVAQEGNDVGYRLMSIVMRDEEGHYSNYQRKQIELEGEYGALRQISGAAGKDNIEDTTGIFKRRKLEDEITEAENSPGGKYLMYKRRER